MSCSAKIADAFIEEIKIEEVPAITATSQVEEEIKEAAIVSDLATSQVEEPITSDDVAITIDDTVVTEEVPTTTEVITDEVDETKAVENVLKQASQSVEGSVPEKETLVDDLNAEIGEGEEEDDDENNFEHLMADAENS